MPEPQNPSEQKIVDDVKGHGWHVVNVLAERELPEFSYSIGLYKSFQRPEVLVYGLPRDSAHRILNDLGENVRGGKRYLGGQVYDGLLEGYACTLRTIPVTQYREHLGWASWFYDYGEFPALQLVYPDHDGRWPWQAEVSESFRRHQLVLADAPVQPTGDDGATEKRQ